MGKKRTPHRCRYIGATEISSCLLAPFKVWLANLCAHRRVNRIYCVGIPLPYVSWTVIRDFFKDMYAKLGEQDQSRHCLVYMHVVVIIITVTSGIACTLQKFEDIILWSEVAHTMCIWFIYLHLVFHHNKPGVGGLGGANCREAAAEDLQRWGC